MKLGTSTIERWYYQARNNKKDPMGALQRKSRSDQGAFRALSPKLRERLADQYKKHPSWSYQLHADNLAVLAEQDPENPPKPSYGVILRFMKAKGLFKRPRRGPAHSPGAQRAEHRFASREVRSYESDYVNALWHLDFHHGSLRVLCGNGRWAYPLLLAILDDCSRLCCHAQWYLAQGAEELVHGLSQAFLKRDLPRGLMSDNGSAMVAAETTQGLLRLAISHELILPYSPYQNGKQEVFWNQIEGRLLPMLENVGDLSLQQLNDATQAWAEIEYNRKAHSELSGQDPLHRFLEVRNVGRQSPDADKLQLAFTQEIKRRARRSDGTLSLNARRLEIPSRYAHFEQVAVRYASWDLSRVHLVEPTTGVILCRLFPQDKSKNAQGHRAPRAAASNAPCDPAATENGMAPLLKKIIHKYAISGLPPAYLPKDPTSTFQQPV